MRRPGTRMRDERGGGLGPATGSDRPHRTKRPRAKTQPFVECSTPHSSPFPVPGHRTPPRSPFITAHRRVPRSRSPHTAAFPVPGHCTPAPRSVQGSRVRWPPRSRYFQMPNASRASLRFRQDRCCRFRPLARGARLGAGVDRRHGEGAARRRPRRARRQRRHRLSRDDGRPREDAASGRARRAARAARRARAHGSARRAPHRADRPRRGESVSVSRDGRAQGRRRRRTRSRTSTSADRACSGPRRRTSRRCG